VGHVTEKLITVKLGGAVPIYWGDDEVGAYFNPKSYVHCKLPELSFGRAMDEYAQVR
jgi:hypothetical protein